MTSDGPTSGSTVRPRTWGEALELRSTRPWLVPVAGGTDLMVAVNAGRLRPEGLLDLSHLDAPEVTGWSVGDGVLTVGAATTWAQVLSDLVDLAPALAQAARTVGSPQIRNRGTIGGNLASASPAGDAHPPLLAVGAQVELESVHARRTLPVEDFFLGPKRSALAPDELVRTVHLPVATGPQQFAKVGPRSAMVIAVVSFALALDPGDRRVGTGLGSAGPTPLRAREAERHLARTLPWGSDGPVPEDVLTEFAELVAAAASPLDDVRGTAAYRRHALTVLARRTLTWAWTDHQRRGAVR